MQSGVAVVYCLTDLGEVLGNDVEVYASPSAEEEFLRAVSDVSDLPGFENPVICVFGCDMEHCGTKNVDAVVVSSVHLHCDRDEVRWGEAKAIEDYDAGKAALTPGVHHGRLAD